MSGKLPGRPNLSLAGKREAPGVTAKSESKRGRGGGRGAGGRGGGRGGKRDAKPKQELIQTGGVFSEGLGGDFPSRKGAPKEADTPQFTVKKAGEARDKKNEIIEQKGDGKASFKSWDELWQSDEENDEIEKKALCPRGIISDLTRGSILPRVLPVEDQPQFLNVLNKNVRATLEEEDDDDMEDKKPIVNGGKTETVQERSAEELIAMFEASTSELMHLQLPSVVASICREIEMQEEGEPMDVDSSQTTRNESGLPNSRNIGKIQVTKKGRILLKIGGHLIDITSKPTKGKQMGAVLLETEPSNDPMCSPPPQRLGEGNNAVYYIGNVKHNLVGSMTWNELNQKKDQIKLNGTEKMQGTAILDAAHVRQIQDIEDVQKSWASLAEQWAIGK